ncbi:hypothetical protein M011DRAFT_469584 [Sporormia fimetaria CBS 119925]|uniref:Uncharacterized protein n=1 Tax=Sporormia fimetaria CBS 119925 TaxID=1340428 RepID=A0A6A6V757_9PLEO|nr:hypothetical protein M011DRAFT_469584 [Sporormia fimetaria CBS 119925]
MSASVQTVSATVAVHSLNTPISFTSSALPSFSTPSYHEPRAHRSVLRNAVDPASRPRSLTMGDRAPPGDLEMAEDIEQASDAAARRPSWIKRLSIVSTSHASSRNSSPGPISPSVSCSNGSMAFSHDGSTAPMVGTRPPSRGSSLPPNKLVKRSSSVHIAQDGSFPGSGSRLPSLRRPATSHQRATLLEMATEDSADPLPAMIPSKLHNDLSYAQFFTAKVSKEKTLSKRRTSVAHGRTFKRIVPNSHLMHKPTLVLARSVAASSEVDDMSSDDGDSDFFLSRPDTPVSITAVDAESDVGEDDDATRSRRSFSLSDLLAPGIKSKKQRASRQPSAKLVRKSSQKVDSVSLAGQDTNQGDTVHGELIATSANRDPVDPAPVARDICSQGGLARAEAPGMHVEAQGDSKYDNTLPPSQTSAVATPCLASMPESKSTKPLTPTSVQPMRPSRHSVTPSEQASTLVGSDNEIRCTGEESDADLETVFDSLRTGATRSTSGARGPRIETIFDESPPSKVKVTALRDLLPKGTFRDYADVCVSGQQTISEEEESITTPVRTIVPERSTDGSPSMIRSHGAPTFPSLVSSAKPGPPKPLSLGTLEWDSRIEDDDSSKWSLEDEVDSASWAESPSFPPAHYALAPIAVQRHRSQPLYTGFGPKPSQQQLAFETPDRDARSTIFDWSEQQLADRSSGARTPPRPRTVHGKKDADRRGSRSVGRRVPSYLHARSQSVPVVPDAGKRGTVVTNKFGTWGVGSKGVSEDWDDDFDFSEIHEEPTSEDKQTSHRVDSGTAMVVPKSIQEQQTNVLANIGLLREWGLLIEELKEHRARGAALGLLQGPTAAMWDEVEAMIDLAEANYDEGISPSSRPASPDFDDDAFGDVSGPNLEHSQERRVSGGQATKALGKHDRSTTNRVSILPSTSDVFGPTLPVSSAPMTGPAKATPDSTTNVTRPRKDSEAKARSVIEALQRRKSVHEPMPEPATTPTSKKVPFDTATLRRIVPYVNTLTRQVKDTLREADGLQLSPSTSPEEPPFSRMFHTDNDLAARMEVVAIK